MNVFIATFGQFKNYFGIKLLLKKNCTEPKPKNILGKYII